MIIADVIVQTSSAKIEMYDLLPRGASGLKVRFQFKNPEWNSLSKTAVFRNKSLTIDAIVVDNCATIPPEILFKVLEPVEVGVYGTDGKRAVAIPTVWTQLGCVSSAANPSGNTAGEHTLPYWAQVKEKVDVLENTMMDQTDLENALIQAKDSGEFNGPKGEKGDKGDPGEKGDTGLQGIQGEKGDPGDAFEAPPIICDATGETIALNMSAERPLHGMSLYGKTTQNGTPTPDAPVPLESVGADGNVSVTVCGKNLFDKATFDANGKTIQFSVIGGKMLYRNSRLGEASCWTIYDPDGNSLGTFKGFGFTATNPLVLPSNASYVITTDAAVMDELYIGYNPNTTYEPYKTAQTLTAQTPNGLPGIPVSSGGNYTDENGQMWVCDEVDFEKGVYVQRVGKILHKGTEPRAVTVMGNYVRTYFVGVANTGGTFSKALSDYLPYLVDYTQESEHFYIASNDDLFCFLKSERLSSVDAVGVQAYFADNPLTVLYVLGTPIETDLTAEEIAQYSALHTNYPNTTIYNDEGAGMGVKYVADTKMYIDNKFAELATAILNA